jgi:hypothetical protein
LRLEFTVRPKDRYFLNYTEISAPDQAAILFFSNRLEKDDRVDRTCLHHAKVASEADLLPLTSARIESILTRVDRLVKPFCIVSITIGKKEIAHLDQQHGEIPSTFFIRLRSRETFWQYFVIAKKTNKPLTIVDQAKKIEFEDTGQARMHDGRVALTFRSKKRIPLKRHPEYRFQLKTNHANGGKVVIKRLPAASVKQFAKERIDGQEALVSEIFINC